MTVWKRWRYKNLTFAFIGLLVALGLSQFDSFHELLTHLGTYGVSGAFLAGALFCSTFTIATGALMLVYISEVMPLWQLLVFGALGSVFCDLLMFFFVKNDLASELRPLAKRFGNKHILHTLHSKHFRWVLPVLGGLIIASPLPDEIGVSLMGLSKMTFVQLIPLSFAFNSLGILMLLGIAKLF